MAENDKTFENLPRSAVEYINLVIKNMRYRKKARDEVREELIDHFELYLKDCATNEEKEQKAQGLISEFGDPKILAVLMRRAKKRCRPLWRTVVARTFQAIAAMVILLILYIAWFFTGKPIITTNYIAELNKRFAKTPEQSGSAFVPVAPHVDINLIFSIKSERTVNQDNTVSFQNQILQISPSQLRVSFAKCRVTVHQHLDLSVSITYGPHLLGYYAPNNITKSSSKQRTLCLT